jgi:IS30 family transposase|uniref:PBSX phage terminase small subunit-like N-terminal domain-containing protein n=1 Tax=Desulfomonile tiedjei TaxID=2358 RepID=A0A7C4EX27_9BACT
MKKNEQRKRAEEAFLTDRGRITNRDLALQLGVHPATVARWKKKDEWDLKLLKTVGKSAEKEQPTESFRETDLRHLSLLNARIDSYLKKKELLPSEILELAEAKFHIMGCMRMLEADMDEDWMEHEENDEHVFD